MVHVHCGFDENKYEPAPHHLPLRTILNGKYLAGKVLGEGRIRYYLPGMGSKTGGKACDQGVLSQWVCGQECVQKRNALVRTESEFSNRAGISLWTRPNVWGSSGDCRGLSL